MSYNFRPYEQKQGLLLPHCLEDWVAEDSLPRFIDHVVEELRERGKLKAFYQRYRADGVGPPAFDPRMMLKILLYAYCMGVTSARRLAKLLESDIGYRYLSANQFPDFRTICEFRKRHLEEFEALFVEILGLCKEANLVKMGRVALDGRRIKGNATRRKNRTQAWLKKQVKQILEEAARVDKEEDEKYGPNRRGDELPEGFRTKRDREKRIREALDRLEKKEEEEQAEYEAKLEERAKREEEAGRKLSGQKPRPPKERKKEPQVNTTDADSRLLKTEQGWIQGYNGQAVADCETQVIVAQSLTNAESDKRQLRPMLEACEAQAGERPAECLADAGYFSHENVALEDERTELFIAVGKDRDHARRVKKRRAPRGRIPKDATPRERMERKLLTRRGHEAYRQRASTIEPVFGQMVMRGLDGFRLRGLKKVAGEWALWCGTHNLLKLFRWYWQPQGT